MKINVQTRQSNMIQQHATEHKDYCMQAEKQEHVLYMLNTVTWISGQEEDAEKVPVPSSNTMSCQCQRPWLCLIQTPDTESLLPGGRIRSF